MSDPYAYFLTFSCYGTHLHGEGEYSVDWNHCTTGGPYLGPNPAYAAEAKKNPTQAPYTMDAERRRIVLESILQTCTYREWFLLAVHVRTNHVHVLVQANDRPPERVLIDLKSYASRALNGAKLDEQGRKRWTRHGSTRYINTQADLLDAMKYIKEEQGEEMALWVNEDEHLIRWRR